MRSVSMCFLEISAPFVIANFSLLIFQISLYSLQSLSTIHVRLISFSLRGGERLLNGQTIQLNNKSNIETQDVKSQSKKT